MRQNRLPPFDSAGLARYFSQISDPSQLQMLGQIASELIRQEKTLSRKSICLKLISRSERAENEAETVHYRALLSMLFASPQ